MKGISAVIAIILILMITVALAAMAYVWFTSVFQSLTESSEGSVEQTGSGASMMFMIESARNLTTGAGNYNISVAMRNTGSTDIYSDKLGFYIENMPATYNNTTVKLETGQMGLFYVYNASAIDDICDASLKITTESGLTQTAKIKCK